MLSYVNLCAAVNAAIGLETRFGIIPEDQFMRLRNSQEYRAVAERRIGTIPTYDIQFWNPSGLEGSLQLESIGANKAVLPKADFSQISGPTMVIMSSTSQETARIYAGLPQGHEPAYFDDRLDNFPSLHWSQIAGLQQNLELRASKYIAQERKSFISFSPKKMNGRPFFS